MTISDERYPVTQYNDGGTFVNGIVNGNIEMVDARTKSAIHKVAQNAPHLAAKLSQLLREGVISPDIALALAGAARSINEDVASWLHQASLNINEDSASRFTYIAEQLKEVANRFDQSIWQLKDASSVLQSIDAEADEWKRAAAAMHDAAHNLAVAKQIQAQAERRFSWDSFWRGFGVGALAILIAIAIGAFMVKG
ncbi:hypothetical protein [Dactylosporangium matsuzakiense]|uniref:Uncharacterized protein n=1 Tax=Dactylosporangium matsuzakiense TaxID=53360 RepID=A0A9W6KN79_9ACTN|nr:hypothetical protein [Dactylosporangium matsuzakiense]GLL05132.1 hypothetical protein GCM10017581_068790 [Dactylosporangium matsuzakiense]